MIFFKKHRDERIQRELNNIYRIGYHVLTFGIMLDLFIQFSDHYFYESNITSAGVRPLEFGTFLAANLLCIILMIRKGIGDDNTRFAETDRFPHGYYLLYSSSASLISSAVFGALMAWQLRSQGYDNLPLIIFITCTFIFLLTSSLIYGLQYLCFRTAKKRRNEMQETLDKDDPQ